ncbi:DNA-binding GntR family transcriptional regulator [Streptomyces umbrinus]|uniref:DNA-binding GntR family transcriptional regulator n=1 Tax=Streptomyces umbrinus TaxID=67370 RepID=A0ABU0T6S6_9ACTN|nr:GntR family transcriptional regulator [Streptomyces umbrinus]MDQ1031476.1 DNA-binding GntR family transcriptional regulator [Streptomyces umbrinus]
MTPESIAQVIRERLADGTYPPGEQLPTNLELRTEFAARPHTIAKALKPLRNEGLICSGLHSRVYAVALPSEREGRVAGEPTEPFREEGFVTSHRAVGADVTDPQAVQSIARGTRGVEQIIRARIADSTYAALTWLPPVTALVAEFEVSHYCVYGALKSLKQEKLVATLNPRGTYVIDRAQPWALPLGRFSQAARIGHTIRQRLGDGTYPPGSQLPTNEQLRTEFEAHPNTISNALRPLRKEGLIYSGLQRRVYAARPAPGPEARQSTLAATRTASGPGARPGQLLDGVSCPPAASGTALPASPGPGEVTISAKNLEDEHT